MKKPRKMLSAKEQGELFMALEAWFESQDINRFDRAYYCATAAGRYVVMQTIAVHQNEAYSQRGVEILQTALAECVGLALINAKKEGLI